MNDEYTSRLNNWKCRLRSDIRNRFTASGNGQILILLLRHSASMEFHCSTNCYRTPSNTRDAQPEAKTGTVSIPFRSMPCDDSGNTYVQLRSKQPYSSHLVSTDFVLSDLLLPSEIFLATSIQCEKIKKIVLSGKVFHVTANKKSVIGKAYF